MGSVAGTKGCQGLNVAGGVVGWYTGAIIEGGKGWRKEMGGGKGAGRDEVAG